LCPSAQEDWEGSAAIGVMEGTAEKPRMTHFPNIVQISSALLEMAKPVTPTEVFRFAAPCVEERCVHFRDSQCNLVTRIVEMLPEAAETLPRCAVRVQCRWWQQEGKAACLRCDQVVTDNFYPSPEMRRASSTRG
jgi:hypothetical protein